MNSPTINDAKLIAERLRARAVIVIAFGDGHYAGASFGHTRAMCDAAGYVLDEIGVCIDIGAIAIPEVLSKMPASR